MFPPDQNPADTFVLAHERCTVIRNTALELALSRARSSGPIPSGAWLTPLTPQAVRAWEQQGTGDLWRGRGGWPWPELAHRFTRKQRSFHAAFWGGTRLCGLCVGRVSKGR